MNTKARGFFGKRPLPKFEVNLQVLRRRTRRDVLLFGAGAVGALAGAGSLLPQDTLTRLGLRRNIKSQTSPPRDRTPAFDANQPRNLLVYRNLLRAYPPMSQAKWVRVPLLLGQTWLFPLRRNLIKESCP
jgi:hypothetical protein